MNYRNIAKLNIQEQSDALAILAENIPQDFAATVEYILGLKGRVILIGMGKSGYIAKKIASSLSSTGTPAFYIHPSEASHGDLGMITCSDLVIILSNSGESKELLDTINYCKKLNIKIVALTMKENSTLAKNSDFILILPDKKETSSISAPTTSALMALSLGDALVTVLHEVRGFTLEDFKLFHPGGKIGVNLLTIQDLMHAGDMLPIVSESTSFIDVIYSMSSKRLGCAIVTDKDYVIKGIVTDGDLRRRIEEGDLTKKRAYDLMTQNPQCLSPQISVIQALHIMNERSITVMPVVENQKLVGVIHIHDIIKAGIN